MSKILVADHAPSPGGRYITDGPFSGEWFREKVLGPALGAAIQTGEKLIVELDGTSGYGSSFLEEAFGGLIRTRAFEPAKVRETLIITANDRLYAPYKILTERFIRDARPQPVAA
jgi:hypothetical protein